MRSLQSSPKSGGLSGTELHGLLYFELGLEIVRRSPARRDSARACWAISFTWFDQPPFSGICVLELAPLVPSSDGGGVCPAKTAIAPAYDCKFEASARAFWGDRRSFWGERAVRECDASSSRLRLLFQMPPVTRAQLEARAVLQDHDVVSPDPGLYLP